ncbi:MAG TPA: ribosomal protein S18-alanine N-acetyltransferase [Candidatus Acidoferrales bacterium]|nr:ribosomal protein S18-alanine N-acetyltransferase [Candidatus Acidoferrales bacterium]
MRQLAIDDIPTAFDLAARCPEASRWSEADYARACGGDLDGWVAEVIPPGSGSRSRPIIGFVFARRVADELEILNFAVEASFRRQGVGSQLLETVFEQVRASGIRRAFLEVRASNAVGIAFYEHHGFALIGRRTRYYSNPLEDALVLSRVPV